MATIPELIFGLGLWAVMIGAGLTGLGTIMMLIGWLLWKGSQ